MKADRVKPAYIWKRPDTAPLPTPEIQQVSSIQLQPQTPHQFCGQALVAVSALQHASTPVSSFMGGGEG